MKKTNVRVLLAALLVLIGAPCAVRAKPKEPWGMTADECKGNLDACMGDCKGTGQQLKDCVAKCGRQYIDCIENVDKVSAGAAGKTPPPNKQGPNPTPSATPHRSVPPRHSGSNPTASATAKPVMLNKSAQASPTPKPKSHKSDHH